MIIMIFLLFLPIVSGVGYAPTTLYGWVHGTDKFSVTITVIDTETMQSFPSEVKTDGNLYITTVTRPDDGHMLNFQVHINYRGDSEIYDINAAPWSLTNLNITISEEGSPSASKKTDSAQGPIITDFIRDSEDKDKFKEKYGTNIISGEKTLQEQYPAPSEIRAGTDSRSLMFALVMFLSLISIVLIGMERHKKTSHRKD